MPKFTLDGQTIPFETGESVLFASIRAGAFIPHYCAHPGLSTVATCRMCMVDIVNAGNGRPLPKLQTSCSTQAADGMEIVTQNSKVKLGREAIMEFLLVNHPLDCPICDQAGECTLQDFSFQYGTGKSVVQHHKRVYGWRDIGTFLQLERNRCIHCTRCVRFSQEITGTHEMGTFGRAHQLTVDTFVDQPLTDLFQGNLADICPVGAITMKDFRFRKRVWHLENTDSVCAGCSTGCNISVQHHQGLVHRFVPRENQEVNRWWMCDVGRVSFRNLINIESRQLQATANGAVQPLAEVVKKISAVWPQPNTQDSPAQNGSGQNGLVQDSPAQKGLAHDSPAQKGLAQDSPAQKGLAHDSPAQDNPEQKGLAHDSLVVGSNQSTNEELYALKTFAQHFLNQPLCLGVLKPATEPTQNSFIQSLITQDKAPNTQGLMQLGFELQDSWQNLKNLDFEQFKLILIVGNPTEEEWFLEAVRKAPLSLHVTHLKSAISNYARFVLPSVSHLEKSGTFTNKQGRLQHNKAAVPQATGCLDECQIWSQLAQTIDPQSNFSSQWQDYLTQLKQKELLFAGVDPQNIPSNGILLK